MRIPDWERGGIQLYLGDCLSILPEIEGVDAIFADPPFNIGKNFGATTNDNRPDYWPWMNEWIGLAWKALRNGGSFYIKNHWRNISEQDAIIRLMEDAVVRNLIVWQKGAGLPSSLCFSMRWEAIWFVTKGEDHTFNLDSVRVPAETNDSRNNPNGKNPTDCWYIPRVAFGSKERTIHPTQCPIKLLMRIVLASSNVNDVVLDPFMGSGTAGVVCAQLGRRFIGVEINQDYFDIAVNRIEAAMAQPRLL